MKKERLFRLLHADEIECRVSTINQKGLSLLLYKDARVDQNILDETVGAFNWQKSYSRDNKNCTVSIWDGDKKQWVSKEDTGTESYTEAEKGLASDSFKRACFNWGIGRELYTAPFIWIKAENCNITQGNNGKPTTRDRFRVTGIEYKDDRISYLEIQNTSLRPQKIVYTFGRMAEVQKQEKKQERQILLPGRLKAFRSLLQENGIPEETVLSGWKINRLEDLSDYQKAYTETHIDLFKQKAGLDGKQSEIA